MFQYINHSFAAKLNIYILSSLTVLFIIGFGSFYHLASRYIENQAYQKISRQTEVINLRVSNLMHKIEKIPENLSWILPVYVTHPDSIFHITHQVVRSNEEIFGCSIAFEPNYFPSKGRHFAPYSYTQGDSVITTQLDSKYDYYHQNWYKLSRENNLSRWSRPYHEYASHDIITSTYSVPLRTNNKIIGVFSVDLSLNWLTEMIDSIKPYPDSYIIIINRSGRYILPKQTTTTIASGMQDTSLLHLVKHIARGETGRAIISEHNSQSYIFYSPITGTDWCLATICPYRHIYEGLNRFNIILLFTFILTLCLFALIITGTIHRITKPLKDFVYSAASIAEGNFKTPLPAVATQDEMKDLHDAFNEMQSKLSIYMNNLEKTIAIKEKIESELHIAHTLQMSMLPKNFPDFPEDKSINLYAVLHPARQVGGDLYDFFIQDNQLYFAIGDVSGKGVPASLLMASTISLLRTFSSSHNSPVKIINALNNCIAERNETDMFVTFFIGKLNLDTGILQYCNAGHTPPVITYPDRTVSFFDVKADLPLGILKNHIYREYNFHFTNGSGMLLYTDGVTDAENEKHEFYTAKRLLETVRQNHELHPKEFIENILTDIRHHIQYHELSDDLTMLTFIFGSEWNTGKK